MKAGAFFRDAWAITEDMGLRTATISTQWAETQDIRETWVRNCLVGTVPPQIPQMSYLAAAPGYPAEASAELRPARRGAWSAATKCQSWGRIAA